MKTLIALLLCFSLASSQLMAQLPEQPKPSGPEPNLTCIEVALVLAISAASLFIIISVACRPTQHAPPQGTRIDVVLMRSRDNGNWEDIATNTIVYDTNAPPIELWRDLIDRDPAFYKVRFQAP